MTGSVKLNSAGGGSITLVTPSTASNVTATIPAATDTLVNTGSTQTLTNKTLTAAGGNTVEATSGPTSSQLAGNRNKIINGAMLIDQRNAGASVAFANNGFPVDRFAIAKSSSAVGTAQQLSTSPPVGFKNYLGITCTTGASPASGDYNLLWHSIEGLNVADLAWGTANAKAVTLSFQVYSSKTGTFAGTFLNGGYSRGYVFTYTISQANTWTSISVTVAGDQSGTWATDNSTGIKISFDLGSGSSSSGTANAWGSVYYTTSGVQQVMATTGATFYITGVQLEKGATATPFENRLYGTELSLCQRYYYKATAGTTFNQLAFCNVRTTTSHYAFLQLPVTMRGNPSSVDYNAVGVIASWGAGVTSLTSLSLASGSYGAGTTQVLLDAVTSGAVGTVGQVSMLLGNNNASAYVALNAEL